MHDQDCAFDEVQEFLHYFLKFRFICYKFIGNAMNVDGSGINVSFWVEVGLKIVVGDFPIDNLNCTDFNDSMPRLRR